MFFVYRHPVSGAVQRLRHRLRGADGLIDHDGRLGGDGASPAVDLTEPDEFTDAYHQECTLIPM